jgi:signal transduction histidine kinase
MSAPWDFVTFAVLAACATLAVIRFARLRQSARAALAALALVLVVGYFYVERAGRREAVEIERLVSAMAPTYAGEIERLGHARLRLDAAPDDPLYLALVEAEKRWVRLNPEIADIYTFRRRPDGAIVFMVDSETDYDRDGVYAGHRESRTAIGEVYEKQIPELEAAFRGVPSFDASPTHDRWGSWVASFVPLRAPDGGIDGVLGVDFEAGHLLQAVRRERLVAMGVLAAVLAVVLVGLASVARLRRAAEELSRRNQELGRMRDVALAASQAKSRFLANVSHELRTPLHVFLGMNELLLQSVLDDRQRRQAETARRAAEGLLGMVDDLLDFAQLEAGKLTSDQFVFDLAELVAAAADSHRASAEAKGLALAAEVDPSARIRILSDPRRVRQILRHLLVNAIKFTDRGEIRLVARIRARSEGQREVVIEVADTGIGVPPERQKEIFDSFSQIDPSATRRYGGTGIGLALSRALAEKLGGSLELESDAGKGSRFRLTFAVREAEGVAP